MWFKGFHKIISLEWIRLLGNQCWGFSTIELLVIVGGVIARKLSNCLCGGRWWEVVGGPHLLISELM